MTICFHFFKSSVVVCTIHNVGSCRRFTMPRSFFLFTFRNFWQFQLLQDFLLPLIGIHSRKIEVALHFFTIKNYITNHIVVDDGIPFT